MAYYSRSALSDLVNSSPLQPETAIEYLRLSCSSPTAGVITDVNATFGDEIISEFNIDGQGIPSGSALQALQVSFFLVIIKCYIY